MSRTQYGKSVSAGQILYWSASSLTTGDPDSDGGCPRRWWWERIDGRRPPSAKWQKLGTEIHTQIENYLTTGRNALGAQALRGTPFIPPPGQDLLVEHDIVLRPGSAAATLVADAASALARAPLRIRGVPVVGYIDLVHRRGVNYGVADGEREDSRDPAGTVEVLDWKTTSRPDFIKSPEAMARTIQMTLYGKWVTTCLPEIEHVRLSHVYFLTRGAGDARKVSLRVLPEQIDRHLQRVERIAGLLADVARETDPNKVEANTRACESFGGCPHHSYCQRDGLADVFGSAGAARIRSLKDVTNPPVNMAARKSLFGKKPFDDPAAVKAAAAKIARDEIEAKHPGLPAAWDELVAIGKAHPALGQPQLGAPLARVIADLEGQSVDPAGCGELAKHAVAEPQELLEFVAQLRDELARPPEIPSILPPDAPAPAPRLAAVVPDEESEPADAGEVPDTTSPAPARGRGRPKGTKNRPKVPDDAVPQTATTTGLVVYVGCTPSVGHEDLWELVGDVTSELNGRAGEVGDFRLVGNDHELAYGRWKGTVATMVRAARLESGHYALRGPVAGDVAPVVVETLRSIVRERGGVFVQ